MYGVMSDDISQLIYNWTKQDISYRTTEIDPPQPWLIRILSLIIILII